jgi:branched-chain amino acid transport system ATP-binding protein
MTTDSADILSIEDLEVAYEGIILALHGVSLRVARGAIVALLGANGAGKTTTLKAASALLRAERGEVTRGAVRFMNRSLRGLTPRDLAQRGLVQVLEGRRCFTRLSVEENLSSGTLSRRASRRELRADLERIYARFPRLKEKRKLAAGYASGGEQQMIALARALMLRPRLVLLDEPSMGLAPQVVEEIFEIVKQCNQEEGVSFLLAEQNAVMALRYADHGYVLETGRVASQGSAAQLRDRDDIQQFYLGVGAEGRSSFRPSGDGRSRLARPFNPPAA